GADKPESPPANANNDTGGFISNEDGDDGVASPIGSTSVFADGITSPVRVGYVAGPSQGHWGSDTPRSQRSLDRLRSHQLDEGMGQLELLRSPSSTAIVKAEGVVGVVSPDGGNRDEDVIDEKSKEVDENLGKGDVDGGMVGDGVGVGALSATGMGE